MNFTDVKEILESVRYPMTHRFDQPPFNLDKPDLRFRGGEHGKLRSSMKKSSYIGDRFERRTYCANTLFDALGFALRRSDSVDTEKRYDTQRLVGTPFTRSKGGRYDPETGEQIEGYRFGFPFLIAIDIRNYEVNFNYKIGDNEIYGPLQLPDVVILFDKEVDLLAKVSGVRESPFYEDLIARKNNALAEGG